MQRNHQTLVTVRQPNTYVDTWGSQELRHKGRPAWTDVRQSLHKYDQQMPDTFEVLNNNAPTIYDKFLRLSKQFIYS